MDGRTQSRLWGCPDKQNIGGGTQNIMVGFTRGERSYVLRRGPRHLRPGTNDVIRREIRLLAALSSTTVRHPRLISACTDEDVLAGAVFYLMEPIDGFNATLHLPALHAENPTVRRAMGFELVDTLSTLGNVGYQEVGLDGFGRPDGFLQRQVPRWLTELDSYSQFAEYPGPAIPHLQAAASWLEGNLPPHLQESCAGTTT